MKPVLLDVSDIQEMLDVNSNLLNKTFLTPLGLLCTIVTYSTERRIDVSDDDNALDLWTELNDYIPKTFSDARLNALLDFVLCDVVPYIEKTLIPMLDSIGVPLSKLYAYPISSGIVALMDEENHESAWQYFFNTPRPTRISRARDIPGRA